MIGIGTGMGTVPMRVPMPIIGAQGVLEHVANYALYRRNSLVQAYDISQQASALLQQAGGQSSGQGVRILQPLSVCDR